MNKKLLMAIVALVIGIGIGYWFANMNNPSITSLTPMLPSEASKQGTANTPEKKPIFYRSAMNPAVTSPVPATDAMGMDYVPVYADDSTDDAPTGTVKINVSVAQEIGVRTTKVKKQALSSLLQAVGRVAYDEERLSRLHSKVEGWVQEIFISNTGAHVKKGDALLSIYSPQLVIGQQEYLLAINNLKELKNLKNGSYQEIYNNAKTMVETSRERLTLLDMPEHQIKELETSGIIKKYLHIHSPYAGIVMNTTARQGQFITPKTELYMLADLSKVWVLAEIYEHELPWVKVGDPTHLKLDGIPGRTFRGKLVYIYPYAGVQTRTIQVRLEFDNPELLMKPNMFASVTIHTSNKAEALVVPSEAIVRSGVREQIFIERTPGIFEPRTIELGVSSNGLTQILKGVEEGETVVTSALFLIDSESKLREATARMMGQNKGEGEIQPLEEKNESQEMNMDAVIMKTEMQMDEGKMNMDEGKMNMDEGKMNMDMKKPTEKSATPMQGELRD